MCGIFGIASSQGLTLGGQENFEKFFTLQNHRGPDGVGKCTGELFSFGMVRLSIIDTNQGWQPFWNESKTIGVLANGEIYNYRDLRSELIANGHTFNTLCDIEVLVHLYEDLGIDFVTRLRGMFAFVIIDLDQNKLVLGRDRLGEKPLYLYEANNKILFSSELRSMIQSGEVPLDFENTYIGSYFKYGFIPEPFTLIKNVRKIASGTIEIFSLDNSEHQIKKYWTLDESREVNSQKPHEELRTILDEVFELLVQADVPVGVALSGGIDSSLVAMITKNNRNDIQAFSVGYEGNHATDESLLATEFAQNIGMEHHVTKIGTKDVARKFGELCLLRDEPIADIAGAGYLAVAELMRSKGVKVLLNGQGGDELFWGYYWVTELVRIGNRRAKLLDGAHNYFEYFRFNRMPPENGAKLEWLKTGFGLFENIGFLIQDFKDRKHGNRTVLVYERRPRSKKVARLSKLLVTSKMSKNLYLLESKPGELDVSPYIFKTMLETYLKSNGLGQMDRLSMAASVEARTPFVDYKVVEFAYRELINKNRFDKSAKALLLEATDDLLPLAIKQRRKKGFTPPVIEWYEQIYSEYKNEFDNPRIVEIGLVSKKARKILKRPLNVLGRPRILWLELAVLEMWVRGLERTS